MVKTIVKPEILAEYIISYLDFEKEIFISNLQLQKIIYLVQKNYIIKNNVPLFTDNFVALKFGPTIYDIYYKYSMYGALPITYHSNKDYRYINEYTDLTSEDITFINNIIDKYSSMDIWDIVKETQKGAWEEIYIEGKEREITWKDIKLFV